MRINRIEIQNFKGISRSQAIDLKPITLLFGPNSAGKSTVLQALHYVREILERQNPDPDQTIAGGLIDLGGFKALVHNLELSRAIYIKLVIDLSEEQGSEWLPINSGSALDDPRFAKLGIRYIVGENTDLKDYAVVQEVGVGIEVRWSDLLNAPFISALDIEMDGDRLASIKSPPQEGRAQLTEFNFSHPLLGQIVDHDDIAIAEDVHEGDLEASHDGMDGRSFQFSAVRGDLGPVARLGERDIQSEGGRIPSDGGYGGRRAAGPRPAAPLRSSRSRRRKIRA